MLNHPLHAAIGNFINGINLPEKCQLIRAPECRGNQNLPLFCTRDKINDTVYCNADAILVKSEKIRFILEIEESGINPTKVCGKFLTSALSKYFIHNVFNDKRIPIDKNATFVQIMDSSKLPERTSIIKKGEYLEHSIRDILPVKGSKITNYRLFFFKGDEDFLKESKKKSELKQIFIEACGE